MATIARFPDTEDDAAILAALRADGAVLVDRFLAPEALRAVTDEASASLAVAEPGMRTVNPMVQAFFGPCTKHVSALAAVSPTFANEVMTHATYRTLCDAVLLPSCARYRLNLGHLIARGPGRRRAVPPLRRRRLAPLPPSARRHPDRVDDRDEPLPRRQRGDPRRARQPPVAA
jgi:hypothetical protein